MYMKCGGWWLISACMLATISLAAAAWGSANQYHIQTDEGPERYFRFQTDNGQFRKEKRLQDGTVIGTEAWIDAAGFLRKKDYIADKNGYRILNSQTVRVGVGKNIEETLKTLKSSAKGGSSAAQSATPNHIQSPGSGYVYSTPRPYYKQASDSSGGKLNYLSPTEAAKLKPSGLLGFDHYPDELPRKYAQTLRKKITNHGSSSVWAHNPHLSRFRTTTEHPSSNIDEPALSVLPPFEGRGRLEPIGIYNTKLTPISGDDAIRTSQRIYPSPAPFVKVENLPSQSKPNIGLLPPLSAEDLLQRNRGSVIQGNALDAIEYETASSRPAGFRYVLANQYHEEAQIDGQKRAGSYGYVDPFGIRRVVYFNASPKGFVHRNNNQYVGVGAKPYDAPGPDTDAS